MPRSSTPISRKKHISTHKNCSSELSISFSKVSFSPGTGTPEILVVKVHSFSLLFPVYKANCSGRSFTKTDHAYFKPPKKASKYFFSE